MTHLDPDGSAAREAEGAPGGGSAPSPFETRAAAVPDVGDALVGVVETSGERAARAAALARLSGALGRSARHAGGSAVLRGRWLADVLLDVAPRIPVRDAVTLSSHHGGRTGDALADALVAAAAKATGTVGAAGGALAAVEWTAPPTLLTTPVQLAAETLAVAAIETKLLAELHAVYDAVPGGARNQRMTAYVAAWAERRGVHPLEPGGMTPALGSAAKRQIRRRLAGRLGRNLTTLGPLLTGAAAGAVVNARETRRLGEAVRADLRFGARRHRRR